MLAIGIEIAQVFDASLLTRPHFAVGNGQHLAISAMCLAAGLGCIELYPTQTIEDPVPPLSTQPSDKMPNTTVDSKPAMKVDPPVDHEADAQVDAQQTETSQKETKLLKVSADGGCFWSCIFLHMSSEYTRFEWSQVIRNKTGFPIDSKRMQKEDRLKS